jgi:autotransporter family porin
LVPFTVLKVSNPLISLEGEDFSILKDGFDSRALNVKTVLAGDNSPTDTLTIDGGPATGLTLINVTTLPGSPGGQTVVGIPIVVAQNGATTTGAFTLGSNRVAAGPFEYMLHMGPPVGGTADEQNTWYLRSSCDVSECVGPGPTPFYRPETTIYGTLPAMARALGTATVGTFNERNGDQDLVRDGSGRAWGRIFGEHNEQGTSGELNSRFDGWLGGVQLGVDIFRKRGDDGSQDAGGVFFALTNAQSDVNGHALGIAGANAGSSDLSGPAFGAYYTHIGPGNWYLDGLAMQTFYEADGNSSGALKTNVGGSGTFLSLEAGIPLPLGFGGVFIEPQAQAIYQHLDFGGTSDQFSTVAFDPADVLTGRFGFRLGADVDPTWRPYLKANIWQDWSGTDRTTYASTHTLSSTDDSTALELGGGLVGTLSDSIAVWGVIDYTTDVADNDVEIIRGNLGVKVGW